MNRVSLRILLWAPLGAGEHYWGPGINAFRLYKNRRERDRIYLCLVHASNRQGFYPDVYDEQVKLPVIESSGIPGMLRYFIQARKWIEANHNRFDVFHGLTAFEYTFRPAIYFSGTGKPSYIKITAENSGFGQNSLVSRISGLARTRVKMANNITGYISLNESIEQNLLNHGVDRTRIIKIPNGVDENLFVPLDGAGKKLLRQKLKIDNKTTLLYVGGITEWKRTFKSVCAINQLIKMGYDIQFYIIGPDRSKGRRLLFKIKDYVANHKLEDRIIFISETSNPDLFYKAADIFLLPSVSEGMPNSLLEAMSCGLASIVTPIPGCRELVEDSIHGLHTSGSINDIVDKIRLLLDNDIVISRYGEAARKLICERYSAKKILDMHIRVFSRSNII